MGIDKLEEPRPELPQEGLAGVETYLRTPYNTGVETSAAEQLLQALRVSEQSAHLQNRAIRLFKALAQRDVNESEKCVIVMECRAWLGYDRFLAGAVDPEVAETMSLEDVVKKGDFEVRSTQVLADFLIEETIPSSSEREVQRTSVSNLYL